MTTDDTAVHLPSTAVLRRRTSPDVEYVEVDGEAVVYDCASNALHLLDPIGTVLWSLLDGTTTLRTTSDELASAFDRPADAVLEDVLHFAAEMLRLDLVERAR